MPLDQDLCYRAVASRDSRFDGQFVTAVRTTGIYCRPSCPATTPLRRNVEFLTTAAAAQQRGYRACRRCLPDAVPGSPEWNCRADLAGRAMRLIGDGLVEREGVPGLARALGYSERHLNRVLTGELGAGPLALARAHRAHTARILVETTTMSMADIAFAAGFSSVRQFNDTVREVYAVSPRTLRTEAAARGARGPTPVAGALVLRLPHRPPFDAAGVLAFLRDRAIDGVEALDGTRYRRTLRLPHGPATVALDLPDGARHVTATLRPTDPRDLGPAVARLRRLLDLDADPVAVDEVLGADPALAPSVAGAPGVRVPGAVDAFELAMRTLLGQQVSVAGARTTTSQLVAALGDPLPDGDDAADDGGPTLLFPTAATVAERGAEFLTGPARRTASIVGFAAAVASGDLVLDPGREPAALRTDLLALPGIGPWSAGYLAMRLLGDPDELLAEDLAVRRGAAALGLPSDQAALTAHAERWRPWRSYAATHLWRASALRPTVVKETS
ncbi:putative 3-methyladenine DNA glycosylase AlkA [Pseudonocardia sulfidoxydans NBRC 16205]|uniref:DNA-3-methyladenine glycosylase II n=1 Tax=Pseudonocardia sulfidoxydans NBRC 16205 TaxID=1223511 RepID=A0A511DJM6_9PSEU|nr:AlkA N-terminal domain-containing protein [Pseudonocardia sulfidoxydans]GEL24483.1 putative 3-methyladenine DNA glycosylase AlkA [Pseudonocardia sulfidoxydans NBRC 16205]